jgi:hypothetical protein
VTIDVYAKQTIIEDTHAVNSFPCMAAWDYLSRLARYKLADAVTDAIIGDFCSRGCFRCKQRPLVLSWVATNSVACSVRISLQPNLYEDNSILGKDKFEWKCIDDHSYTLANVLSTVASLATWVPDARLIRYKFD